jgi:SAM-dependent methyltransferase
MSEPFGPGYAAAYNALYAEKDYSGECDLLEQVFATYATRPVTRILDLGCGTGVHARELALRGYEVVGVDRSESMLDQARSASSRATFLQGDVRSVDLHRRFDAVVLLFAVLGYQLSDVDVLAALKTARSHLGPGGLLGFDVWYGPSVLAQRPSTRTRTVDDGGQHLVRTSSGTLDERRNVVRVEFELTKGERAGAAQSVFETHQMRYFFSSELEDSLTRTGFELLRIGAFPDFDQEPDETTWSVFTLARAL